jgi:hypothetical protein
MDAAASVYADAVENETAAKTAYDDAVQAVKDAQAALKQLKSD